MFLIRLWDALIAILILFPILAGGFWIKRPGLFIEHTELAVPTAIAAILTWVWIKGFRISLNGSLVRQAADKALSVWRVEISRNAIRALCVASGFVASFYAAASLRRHWSLGSSSFDLGIFTNTLWNLVNGHGYVSSVKGGINLFLDHQSPILWLFAPFYWLLPTPETLLVLQALGLALGAIPLYYLSAQYLKRDHWFTAISPVLYWAYLPLRNANAFDFHPETLMLPLFLAMIAGLQSESPRKRILGWLSFVLALACKETASPVAIGIGIAWIFGAAPEFARARLRKKALWVIAISLAVFYFNLRIVPALLGGTYAYSGMFSQFGDSALEIALAPFLKADVFWPHIFNPVRLRYLFWALLPLGFLPVLNWRAAVASIPGFLMLFASEGDHRVNLIYHYVVEWAPGLFWAMPVAIQKASRSTSRQVVTVWLLFFTLAGFGRSELFRIRFNEPTVHADWLRREVLPCLNPTASTAASDPLVPHLSGRRWIQNLSGSRKYTSCVVIDSRLKQWPLSVEEWTALPKQLSDQGFKAVYQCQTTQIFQLDSAGISCMRCEPRCAQY